ncbi:SRPBCC domain-containing protein [Spiractinospora alimapuensis]|uniref:SRPBCC family protein n=1 Tax=Spiractinospora alimapuensis TaxID=2820884 RepID=UPI001F40ABFD|nr:SRPBCC domain-containing protein [Spiractinospora alimapuensis]QVQ51529.1 SRPBCC domain-containing protein [Spiractinospora alimapuensis]
MSVTSMDRDDENLTMTLVADFAAPVRTVWKMWSDPRQLEEWWGPPTYPATVEEHELTPGGMVTYFMTSPEGDEFRGWWRVVAVDAPSSLEFVDGFAGPSGEPLPDMPSMPTKVTLSKHNGGTQMVIHTTFASAEDMDKLVKMGMEEGLTEAVGQIDELLDAS